MSKVFLIILNENEKKDNYLGDEIRTVLGICDNQEDKNLILNNNCFLNKVENPSDYGLTCVECYILPLNYELESRVEIHYVDVNKSLFV